MNTRKGYRSHGTTTLERRASAAPDSRADAYQQVTDQIIAMLEAGTNQFTSFWTFPCFCAINSAWRRRGVGLPRKSGSVRFS
jgi:antirestriction protein ArdC